MLVIQQAQVGRAEAARQLLDRLYNALVPARGDSTNTVRPCYTDWVKTLNGIEAENREQWGKPISLRKLALHFAFSGKKIICQLIISALYTELYFWVL